jgi:hypothetical protein
LENTPPPRPFPVENISGCHLGVKMKGVREIRGNVKEKGEKTKKGKMVKREKLMQLEKILPKKVHEE